VFDRQNGMRMPPITATRRNLSVIWFLSDVPRAVRLQGF